MLSLFIVARVFAELVAACLLVIVAPVFVCGTCLQSLRACLWSLLLRTCLFAELVVCCRCVRRFVFEELVDACLWSCYVFAELVAVYFVASLRLFVACLRSDLLPCLGSCCKFA